MKRSSRAYPHGLAEKLPWRAIIAPGVMLLKKEHALMRCYAVRGVDWSGDTPETLGARMVHANDILKRLSGAWTMHTEAQRVRITTYHQRRSPHTVSMLLDAEKRAIILGDPHRPTTGTRETNYYCTLTWTPPQGYTHALRDFYESSDGFMGHMRGLLATMEPLEDDEMLSYLKTTISDRWHPVYAPRMGTDISQYLCDAPWSGGTYPEWDAHLGRRHVRILTLTGYPARSHAGMMRYLEMLPIDYRWCTRWTGIEKHLQDGILSSKQSDWVGQEKNPWQRAKEIATKREELVINEDATRKAEDISLSRQNVGADVYGVGNFSTTIVTWGETADDADHHRQQIQHALESSGLIVRHEGAYGARLPITTWCLQYLAPPHHTAAWLSTHPGNTEDNIRRTLQNTMSVAHMMPGLRASWPGPERDEYMHGPAWFLARTEETNLIRISNHIRDVGHHKMVGPTGSGKSTFVGHNLFHWFLYPNVQAHVFDLGRSTRLITHLLGGEWIDLGQDMIRLQPLRHIDDPQEMRWALDWLLGIMDDAHIPEDILTTQYLSMRLQEIARLPIRQRTLSALLHCCEAHARRTEPNIYKRRNAAGLAEPDQHLRTRLELYIRIQAVIRSLTAQGGGVSILDGDRDDIGTGHLITLEQKELLEYPRLAKPAIQYSFHLLERRFSTASPTLSIMEEAAMLALSPIFRNKFDEWLMTKRKEGVSVGFVINSLEQATNLGLGLLSRDNCPVSFYFPNAQATAPETAEAYEKFGLTSEERRLIATARPYRDIYYTCRELGWRRVFHLDLTPLMLDCLGRNSEDDHTAMDTILAREGREGFASGWLEHCGHYEAARQIRERTIPYVEACTL